MSKKILLLDQNGYPLGWINPKRAICEYYAKNVLWDMGLVVARFRSGVSRLSNKETIIETKSIISIKGSYQNKYETASNKLGARTRLILFSRDNHRCAYCGHIYDVEHLSKDHIIPLSKGGEDTWLNTITACISCNARKADKHLTEIGLKLLYQPYIPSKYETLILRNQTILSDQFDFLIQKVPKTSRLLNRIR